MKLRIPAIIGLMAASLVAPGGFAQSARRVIVQHPGTSYLGIGALEVTAERAKALNLKEDRGVEVAHVEDDSPAAKAGIKEGDVVLEYNGEKVEGVDQFIRLVHETPPGREVKMAVWRNGKPESLTLTVGARRGTVIETPGGPVTIPPMPPMPPIDIPRFEMSYQSPLIGIEGESLAPQGQLADFFGVTDGVLVKSVIRNSPAERAGLKAGDVIVKVDNSKVTSPREITSVLRSYRDKGTFTVTVVRNKKEMPLTVTLPGRNGRVDPPVAPASPA
ncbi:MAG TPA: PDZ domain-containing protein [Bryobacteraceae bacterium]|nr:PDZ domain-containing protein [Bryobacteraceae bacterium]